MYSENTSYENGLPAPYSEEAEKTIIGSVLKSPDILSTVLEQIKPESFYIANHQRLFLIIYQQFTLGEKTDVITVMNEAVRLGIFESDSEARRFLAAIIESVPTVANIESYCKIVAEHYRMRQLVAISNDIIRQVEAAGDTPDAILNNAEQMIFDLRQGKEVGALVKIGEAAILAYAELNNRHGEDKALYLGARSGFSNLDNITTGLNKSDLIILAARPGMGKTSFALNILTNTAKMSGKTAVFFSLEMSNEQLCLRLFSSIAKVSSTDMRNGTIKPTDWTEIAKAMQYISELPILLDDSGGNTVAQIKSKLLRVKNLGFVAIDYLGLLSSTMKNENVVARLSDMTRQLKLLAKDLNVPVMVLSQLSRAVENRQDKRPILADLRDSGSIEQDADIVMFLYRDGYYNANTQDPTEVECIVAKNRHGEAGVKAMLHWDGEYTRFSMPTNMQPPF